MTEIDQLERVAGFRFNAGGHALSGFAIPAVAESAFRARVTALSDDENLGSLDASGVPGERYRTVLAVVLHPARVWVGMHLSRRLLGHGAHARNTEQWKQSFHFEDFEVLSFFGESSF
jgi:hypothetical protein